MPQALQQSGNASPNEDDGLYAKSDLKNVTLLDGIASDEDVEWDLKSWLTFVQEILLYVNSLGYDPDPRIFKAERHVLKKSFGKEHEFFCYLFKGRFLPSADADGFFWKPSQSAKPAMIGSRVIKRYFYHTSKEGDKMNRQVSWLEGSQDWHLIEYRAKHQGGEKLFLSKIEAPEGFSWPLLYKLVSQFSRENNHPDLSVRVKKEITQDESEGSDHPQQLKEEQRKKRGTKRKKEIVHPYQAFDLGDEWSQGMIQLEREPLSRMENDPFEEDYSGPSFILSSYMPEQSQPTQTNPFTQSREEREQEQEQLEWQYRNYNYPFFHRNGT